ncbi:site-specific DNA-methyltransferase [Ottowia sp.]|jgi:adenine-specific DNA-methyltransferase|uniref:site-specific DNA-methyltransferase n=1 Tax=Ottowia sp. TaxID=1898956 RepID=UPI0025FC5CDC|nr:site-specific DNA-methyltransferase [Ottowia sp.]MBK6614248.1 site-specific DNA-methyltransferase [Ottowia sp.]
MATRQPKAPLVVDTLKHEGATRKNIPTAEYQSVMARDEQSPKPVAYPRANTQWLNELAALHDLGEASELLQRAGRLNRDLDPQLLWRGKDQQDWSDLVVNAPPLYIQEKVHPKVLIDDLRRETERQHEARERGNGRLIDQVDLFADFNGLPSDNARTEFYQHDGHWANRMILGDSLQVMASLAEREGLRGKVQCIYFDPPYGIKFNSNFQWSTTSRDVKDGNAQHITREPEQVKAFRDTWRDGIHSYLTYLRDRLTVARDLLTESGSIFVQIGDENVHRVRAVMDEVFGDENCCSEIVFRKTTGKGSALLDSSYDVLLWYTKDKAKVKYRPLFDDRTYVGDDNLRFFEDESYAPFTMSPEQLAGFAPLPTGAKVYHPNPITSARSSGENDVRLFEFKGRKFSPGTRTFSTNEMGLSRLRNADRLLAIGNTLRFKRYLDDFRVMTRNNIWDNTRQSGFSDAKVYVVQTPSIAIQQAILMTTDPGDLILDPTCGSGTTAYVAEQWGRRWITIDTSRVALALARARIMGARYPYYLLADSREGQLKEAEVTRSAPSSAPVHGDVRQGFVYERVPHITLKSIANNAEIDVIWAQHQQVLEPLRAQINALLGTAWQEWELPRALPDAGDVGGWKTIKLDSINPLSDKGHKAKTLINQWWQERIARQKEIDASIAAKAEFEYLYDKPYPDKNKVRVAGPFTVESLSPHRVLAVGADDELIDPASPKAMERQAHYNDERNAERNFVQIILENLKTAGVQQAHKQDKITFTSLTPWPGELVCAEGRYAEGDAEKRAAIFIGPEFGTVARPDLVAAAREAGDAGFDVLIACAFNYDAHSSEFDKLGRIPVLKARMNADLHMADDLKNTGKGNLFVIFGEPDIDILDAGPEGADGQLRVKVNGVDVFHPNTGEVRSDGADGIACWFIDTDYNEESFFVRHAYFLGANDPYKSLKTTLKAEVDADAWATLNSDTSRPFDKPKSGRIAVKVINHLGDEVMKVFRVS